MKKALVLLTTLLLLAVGNTAMAEEPAPPEAETVIAMISGTVAEVSAAYDPDGAVIDTRYSILVETEAEGLASFAVDTETCLVSGKPPVQAQAGDNFTGTYDAAQPMLMIYPPQYTALSILIW